MSLEQAMKDLAEAVRENTAAHAELAKVAVKASGQKAPAEPGKTEAEDAGAAEAKKKAAAEKAAETRRKKAEQKKAEEKKAEEKKAEEPDETGGTGEISAAEIVTEISAADLHTKARSWMGVDDAGERDTRKANLSGALKHLGVAKLSELTDDDRAKVASYINAWDAGQEKIDFEAIDAKVSGEDDDLLD